MCTKDTIADKLEQKRTNKERIRYEKESLFNHIQDILGQSVFDHNLVKDNAVVKKEIRAAATFIQVVSILQRERNKIVAPKKRVKKHYYIKKGYHPKLRLW